MTPAVMALYLRSLRLESRRFVTYLVRLGLVITILFSLVVAHLTSMFTGAPGLHFFSGVCFINLGVILLVSLAYFTSAIAEEREEMTLGLLRMTGLSPLAILFGKSTSRLVGALMLILAQLPFTLLAVSLGGVATLQVYAAYLCLVAFMFMLCNVALLFSVLCRKAVTAGGGMMVALVVYFFAPLMLGGLAKLGADMGWYPRGGAVAGALEGAAEGVIASNAFVAMSDITGAMFTGPLVSAQVVSNVLIGILSFVLAWLFFNMATREQKDISAARGFSLPGLPRLSGMAAGRTWKWPIVWKEFHFGVGGLAMQASKCIVLLFAFVLIGFFMHRASPRGFLENMGPVIMITMLIVAYLELLHHAATMFNSEAFGLGERGQTLPGLLMLPVTAWRIAYEKVAGCLLALVPYAAFFLIGLLMNPAFLLKIAHNTIVHPGLWVVVGYLILFLYLNAYFSLLLKRTGFIVSLGIMLVGQFLVRSMFMTGLLMAGMMGPGRMSGVLGEFIIASFDLAFIAVIVWLLHRGVLRRIATVAGQ